ncbi:Uncharacterised protein [Mycobacterium tuberculosis]|nr:Uncharacterised protein [Mycobacterium tuberculosis]
MVGANAAALACASVDPMPARSEAAAANTSGDTTTNDIALLRSVQHRMSRMDQSMVSLSRIPNTGFHLGRLHSMTSRLMCTLRRQPNSAT